MKRFQFCLTVFIYVLGQLFSTVIAFPDPGKWDFVFDKDSAMTLGKSLFKDSQIVIQVSCAASTESKVTIIWRVSPSACWQNGLLHHYPNEGQTPNGELLQQIVKNNSIAHSETLCECSDHDPTCELKEGEVIQIQEQDDTPSKNPSLNEFPEETNLRKRSVKEETVGKKDAQQSSSLKADEHQTQSKQQTDLKKNLGKDHHEQSQQILPQIHSTKRPVYRIPYDGFYTLNVEVKQQYPKSEKLAVKVHIEMLGKHGYLSAADWPLLPFYGAMCLVYLVMGLAWLIVSFLQWRDLLRIQFWIGGVILLGMLEKAMFYAEYQSINTTGEPVPVAMLIAELVSCGKRTLARMLVIIVSLGFGIVKPRLGAMLQRVVGTGILYFILAASEAYIQVMRPKNDPANQLLIANVPLAVLDSAICWWIFTSLVQTTRTLRLRRNVVKLNLYRHFTTTLIFAVFSSIIFMLYSIRVHHFTLCFTNWKELWVDDAYWRLLFSVILLVIMILWRPTNNNQRYAFTPLLDAPEDDDDDDDDEEYFVNDAYGVKMRPSSGTSSPKPKPKASTNSAEEDLKWVEDNIPSSLADSALPVLDSDEEIMNTRFEISKMQ